MKISSLHFFSVPQFSRQNVQSSPHSQRSYFTKDLREKRKLLEHKTLEMNKKIKKKIKSFDHQKNLPILPPVPEKPVKNPFPCRFVPSLDQKNEVLGTPLMNRLIRFFTKKGKKSKAYDVFVKTSILLAHFETQKIHSHEISQENSFHENKKGHSRKLGFVFFTMRVHKINQFMTKKNKTQTVSPSLLKTSSSSLMSSYDLIEKAISHVKPFLEVKKVRVAGTTYQVPAILENSRQENYAFKWIVHSAFERHQKNPSQPFEYSLAHEIYEAFHKQGQARLKKNELHKLAESQRAFAHFRWW